MTDTTTQRRWESWLGRGIYTWKRTRGKYLAGDPVISEGSGSERVYDDEMEETGRTIEQQQGASGEGYMAFLDKGSVLRGALGPDPPASSWNPGRPPMWRCMGGTDGRVHITWRLYRREEEEDEVVKRWCCDVFAGSGWAQVDSGMYRQACMHGNGNRNARVMTGSFSQSHLSEAPGPLASP
ncbi:hypothetical protein B0I35DRAFT_463944 [Stachybotrys elegans]|uniref:Uncharacterized protein n=1 Tax=Stachybotrys elegans TaxID=80388 RepID=A0A8K0SGD8_9HYPO|nr:hypothetical protein B0I35DRAFT_463944 [Stachybotrys elegans]